MINGGEEGEGAWIFARDDRSQESPEARFGPLLENSNQATLEEES